MAKDFFPFNVCCIRHSGSHPRWDSTRLIDREPDGWYRTEHDRISLVQLNSCLTERIRVFIMITTFVKVCWTLIVTRTPSALFSGVKALESVRLFFVVKFGEICVVQLIIYSRVWLPACPLWTFIFDPSVYECLVLVYLYSRWPVCIC